MTTVNNRTLSGIISLSDGNGTTIENGKVTTNVVDSAHLNTDTSEIGDMDIDRLLLQEHLNVNSTIITPVWLSYLYGLTGNIQTQINSISSSLLSTANTWTAQQLFTGNAINLVFEKTSTLFPTRNSNTIGAIYASSAFNKALSFINSSNNFVTTTPAFVWSKQDSSTTAVTLMSLSNSGTLTCTGNVNSPNISGLVTSVNNLQTEKQDLIDSSNRLNANLVGDGSVDNTEYSYLNGVTSSIQTQINSISTAILSSINTWTNANYFSTGWVEWTANASGFPTFSANGRGAIQGRPEALSGMCFINNNIESDPSTGAFHWFKMVNASLLAQIAQLSNAGDLILQGTITSPTISTIYSDFAQKATANIFTALNTFNANIRMIANSRIEIKGNNTATTLPTSGTESTWLYGRGGSTYGDALSFVNAFAEQSASKLAFAFTKRTGTFLDLFTITNNGECRGQVFRPVKYFQGTVDFITTGTAKRFYTWDNLRSYIYKSNSRAIELPYPGNSVLLPYDGATVVLYHTANGISTNISVDSPGLIRVGTSDQTSWSYGAPGGKAVTLVCLDNQWCVVDLS
jgi:hypothetical protein